MHRLDLRSHLAAIAALLLALPAAAAATHAPSHPARVAAIVGHETLRGSGRAATEERSVSGFHAIAVSVPAHVTVVQGDAEGVTLDADDNVIGRIETAVDGGVLRIRFAHGLDVRPVTPIRATVRVKSLDAVDAAGAVTIEVPRLEGASLAVKLAGAGRIVLPDVKLGELSIATSGHAHGLAIGRADALEVHMAGGGEMNAVRLDAKRAEVRIAGSAKVVLWVHDRLDAAITGSGSVAYFGDPEVKSRVSGSGRVRRAGAAPP